MAQSYENLEIWKKSVDLAEYVYSVSKKFPKDESFGLISQIRRAVVSVSSNIAEGSSRVSKKDFCRFIDISIGSLKEVESLSYIALRLGYMDNSVFAGLLTSYKDLGLKIGGFRKYLSK